MKTLIKLSLVLCLFGSVALADGEMGSGGRQCPPEGCTPPPCQTNCGNAQQLGDNGLNTSDIIEIIVRQGLRLRF